jgi:hypothetical protein
MGLNYLNLDAETRAFMVEESNLGGHYKSPRLSSEGLHQWPDLLTKATENHNDDWLAQQLLAEGFLNSEESYTRKGKPFTRVINKPHAAQQLAEGEFNRYYLRGLCRRAQKAGIKTLIIYRAKDVAHPRPESEAKIDTHVDVDQLLTALRSNDFVSIEDTLKIPGGPNSGLSARLP